MRIVYIVLHTGYSVNDKSLMGLTFGELCYIIILPNFIYQKSNIFTYSQF